MRRLKAIARRFLPTLRLCVPLLWFGCHGPMEGPKPVCDTCRVVCGQCEEPDRFVRLSAATGNPTVRDSLPAAPTLSPDAWAKLLACIRVQKHTDGLVALLLSQGSMPQPAFMPEEITYLSVTLPQAFAQAQPGDVALFAMSRPGAPDLVELTSGGWFFAHDGLHLRLANYHYVASMESIRDLVWENPLHAHVSEYEFVRQAHQVVKEETGLLRAHPIELVLSHEAILASPSARTGGSPASSTESPESRHEPSGATIDERLRTLKRLHDQGLISDTEYGERKRLLLDAL